MTSSAQALSAPQSVSSRAQAEVIASGCDELTLARVHAAGAGDRQAQRWLAEAVLADVRTVARSLSRCTVEADDAAQFAVLQVLHAAEQFRGQASVRTWARRVATFAVLKHQRSVRTRQARELLYETDVPTPTTRPASAPLGEALPRSLREYLAELPPEQSEALVLKHALGYSVPEIAELTESSPNTVKSRLRIGVKQLRRRIRQETLAGPPKGAKQ